MYEYPPKICTRSCAFATVNAGRNEKNSRSAILTLTLRSPLRRTSGAGRRAGGSNKLVAAGPVSRILSAGLLPQDGHSSGPRITAGLKRPTRRFDAPSRHVLPGEPGRSLPIWSCSVWGLPCPLQYCRGGALLPHLFTLTSAFPPRRYVLCGTSRQPGLNPAARTLSGTLLCGVRTFLPQRPKAPRA